MTAIQILLPFVIIFILLGVFQNFMNKKRREALSALAGSLGLSFSPNEDYAMVDRYHFLHSLGVTGDNKYTFNVLQGLYQGYALKIFTYHYETYTSGKYRSTQHHYFTVLVLELPSSFPQLAIAPEGLFSKLGQAMGFDDIDFESKEFSDSFCVRSENKKFAYDFCNAQMIDYLLGNKDLKILVEKDTMALVFIGQIKVENIAGDLEHLVKIRSFIPGYLLTQGTV